MNRILLLSVLSCLPVLALAQGAAPLVRFEGVVLAPDGKPVANAEVGMGWWRMPEAGAAFGAMGLKQTWRADAEGRFSASERIARFPVAITAINREGTHAAMQVVSQADVAAPLRFELRPLLPVTFRLDLIDRPARAPEIRATVVKMPENVAVGDFVVGADDTIGLLAGEYNLIFQGLRTETIAYSATVGPGGVDMGALAVHSTGIEKAFGKAPPAWNVTEARGVKPDAKLSDFKGKYVLVEFWGFW
jgi:hypothetical protein